MNIPASGRTKALFVVDVQKGFLDDRTNYIVPNILKLIATVPYDAYVLASFHAGKGSRWEKQQGWTFPRGPSAEVVPEIMNALRHRYAYVVEKETRSVFKGMPDVFPLLKKKGIEEIHVVGTQTNDCILATCLDAFDLGFYPYAIEECCEAEPSELHKAGLRLLQEQCMTNNSLFS